MALDFPSVWFPDTIPTFRCEFTWWSFSYSHAINQPWRATNQRLSYRRMVPRIRLPLQSLTVKHHQHWPWRILRNCHHFSIKETFCDATTSMEKNGGRWPPNSIITSLRRPPKEKAMISMCGNHNIYLYVHIYIYDILHAPFSLEYYQCSFGHHGYIGNHRYTT